MRVFHSNEVIACKMGVTQHSADVLRSCRSLESKKLPASEVATCTASVCPTLWADASAGLVSVTLSAACARASGSFGFTAPWQAPNVGRHAAPKANPALHPNFKSSDVAVGRGLSTLTDVMLSGNEGVGSSARIVLPCGHLHCRRSSLLREGSCRRLLLTASLFAVCCFLVLGYGQAQGHVKLFCRLLAARDR